VLRSSRGLAGITLERDGIDLPVEVLVPCDDAALGVQLDDFAADRDALFFRAVPVGVVEERLDPAGLLAVAHLLPSVPELRLRGRISRRFELFELRLRDTGSFAFSERTETVPLELQLAPIWGAILISLGRFILQPGRREEPSQPTPDAHEGDLRRRCAPRRSTRIADEAVPSVVLGLQANDLPAFTGRGRNQIAN
jgi:hypothetical protein